MRIINIVGHRLAALPPIDAFNRFSRYDSDLSPQLEGSPQGAPTDDQFIISRIVF
jgi:hypothetical protein